MNDYTKARLLRQAVEEIHKMSNNHLMSAERIVKQIKAISKDALDITQEKEAA
jgi:hypothetical protein